MENLNLVRKVTWAFAQKTNHDWDELFSVAMLNYAEAINSYNAESKTKFSTYAYTMMRNALVNFCKHEQVRISKQLKLAEGIEFESIFNTQIPLEEVIDNWSDSCKQVLTLVLNNFEELDQTPPKLARGAIVRELRQQGWKWQRIWSTMNEMKQVVRKAEFSY